MLTSTTDLLSMSCCSLNPTATTMIPTLPNGVQSITFTPSGCLATVNDLGEVNVYTPTSNPCVYDPTSTGEIDLAGPAFNIASSPSGCLAVATSAGVTVLEPIGSCGNCIYAPSTTISSLVDTTAVGFSNDNCLATGDAGGVVNIYGLLTPGTCTYDTTPVTTFTIPSPAQINALAFSPTTNCLVVGDMAGNVNVYSQISLCSYTITPSDTINLPDAVTSIAFDSTGCPAIADNSGQVTIYQSGSGCTFVLPATTTIPVTSPAFVAFSPVNGCLAVGSADGSISTYSPMGGCAYNPTPVSVITGGTPLSAIAYSPNGCLAGGWANSINIYEPNATLATIISPDVSFVCFGQTIMLNALTTGGISPYTYVWTLPDGSTVSTGLSNTLTIPNPTEVNSGLYTVEVTDSANCTATNTAFVEVSTLNASLQATPDTICAGQSTTLSTNISGGFPPYTVTFTGFAPIVSAGPIVTQIATPLVTTNYSVTVVDNRGCSVTTGPITVTVQTPTAPTIGTVTVNCNGTITIMGTGNPGDLIQVSNPPNQIAVPVIVANDGTFTITTIPLAPGTYTNLSLTAVVALNCSASTPIPSVTIPSAVGVSIAPNPSIVCAGSTIMLTATGAGGTLPYSYAWTGPGGFTDTGNVITRPNATRAMAGIYTVTLTDANGCTTSASVLVRVVDIGVTLSSSNQFLCGGDSATLTAIVTSGVPPYTFTFSDGFIVNTPSTSVMHVVTPAMTTSYTVTVVDSTPCSAMSASNMIVVSVVTPPSGLTATSNCNGAIFITGMAAPGNTITVFNGNIPVAGPIIVPLSGNFSLNTGPLPADTYTLDVTATNSAACTATTPAPPVVVNPAFSVTIAPPSQSIAAGSTLNLIANTLGGSPGTTNYAWTSTNGFIQNGTSNVVMRPNATASFGGTYNVVATDSAGCTASGSATVTVV